MDRWIDGNHDDSLSKPLLSAKWVSEWVVCLLHRYIQEGSEWVYVAWQSCWWHRRTYRHTDRQTVDSEEWMNEWMSEWMNVWMNVWMNEWMSSNWLQCRYDYHYHYYYVHTKIRSQQHRHTQTTQTTTVVVMDSQSVSQSVGRFHWLPHSAIRDTHSKVDQSINQSVPLFDWQHLPSIYLSIYHLVYHQSSIYPYHSLTHSLTHYFHIILLYIK